ncbi:hypothetical protein [uncultured Bilophila sp.]|uniref:hypothetical protein n=1 Tax=uncultured Bilophila sp. TaxID=529385 RepID=UPI00280A7F83|nr:hypothetical protein [uncultured Bilophila sp.]
MTTADTNPLAPTAPGIDVNPVETIAVWTATCSNTARNLADCKAATDAMLAELAKADVVHDRVMGWVSSQMMTVFINRDRDLGFIEMMFAYDDAKLAEGCVDMLMNALQHIANVPFQDYIDAYVERYGENRVILTLKLRWLTMYTNYSDNVAEVERILGILSAPEAA